MQAKWKLCAPQCRPCVVGATMSDAQPPGFAAFANLFVSTLCTGLSKSGTSSVITPGAASAVKPNGSSAQLLQQGSHAPHRSSSWQQLLLYADVDMEDVSAEALAEVAHLRADKAYLQVLDLAADMDIDSEQAEEMDTTADVFGDIVTGISSRVAAAMAAAAQVKVGSSMGYTRLLVVVDTNILLSPKGMALLEHLRREYGPAAQNNGSKCLQVVAILPWIVIMELDRLSKYRTDSSTSSYRSMPVLLSLVVPSCYVVWVVCIAVAHAVTIIWTPLVRSDAGLKCNHVCMFVAAACVAQCNPACWLFLMPTAFSLVYFPSL